MKKTLIILGALIVVVYVVMTAFVAVHVTETVVITHFGKPIRVLDEAGLKFKLPDPIQTAIRLDKRLQPLDSNIGEYLTHDKKNLVVSNFVLWRIIDAKKFIQSVKDAPSAERRLSDLVGSELGVQIGTYLLSSFLSTDEKGTKLSEILEKVTNACREQARKQFGIEVVGVCLSQLSFPDQNLRSVYSRMRAERERMAKKYRAEGEEGAANIKATTNKEVREILAAAYRKAQITRGKGDAEATRIYAEAFKQDPEFYKLTRTLDSYRKFLDEKTTLILSTDSPLFRYLESPPEVE
jgi:membrane protease subunit HflC